MNSWKHEEFPELTMVLIGGTLGMITENLNREEGDTLCASHKLNGHVALQC